MSSYWEILHYVFYQFDHFLCAFYRQEKFVVRLDSKDIKLNFTSLTRLYSSRDSLNLAGNGFTELNERCRVLMFSPASAHGTPVSAGLNPQNRHEVNQSRMSTFADKDYNALLSFTPQLRFKLAIEIWQKISFRDYAFLLQNSKQTF